MEKVKMREVSLLHLSGTTDPIKDHQLSLEHTLGMLNDIKAHFHTKRRMGGVIVINMYLHFGYSSLLWMNELCNRS